MWARVPHPGSRPKNSRVIGLTTWVVNRRRNQSLVVAATVRPLLARSGGGCHRDLDHRCVPRPNVPPARPEIVTRPWWDQTYVGRPSPRVDDDPGSGRPARGDGDGAAYRPTGAVSCSLLDHRRT